MMHKCYRESISASAMVATMIGVHHAIGTWRNAVDLYLTPTEFARGNSWPEDGRRRGCLLSRTLSIPIRALVTAPVDLQYS